MIPIETLIFDLDGTLVDSRKDLTASVNYIQHRFGFTETSEEEVAASIGDGVTKLLQRAMPTVDAVTLERAVPLFKTYYHEHCMDATTVYPDVEETLRHFRNKKMAVVTNKPGAISQYILNNFGFSDYFPIVIGGDDVEHRKPEPDAILAVLERLTVAPDRAVMVGDSAQDILAGRAAKVKTCGILSNIGNQLSLQQSEPEFLILKISELVRLFS